MNKRDFRKFLKDNLVSSKVIYCRIWNSFDDGEYVSWLDIYIEEEDYPCFYCSDYFDEGSKELLSLQKEWGRKINRWVKDEFDLKVIVDVQNI